MTLRKKAADKRLFIRVKTRVTSKVLTKQPKSWSTSTCGISVVTNAFSNAYVVVRPWVDGRDWLNSFIKSLFDEVVCPIKKKEKRVVVVNNAHSGIDINYTKEKSR